MHHRPVQFPAAFTTWKVPGILPSPFRVWTIVLAASAAESCFRTAASVNAGFNAWARCKSFDTFTPLGPFVETMLDPNELSIQQFQNGQLRQNSNTRQLIFKPAEIVSFVSTNMTLLPGDVILTGTPSGVGPIQSGDKLEVRIKGLASLTNTVK
jgi:hypothetical protein